MLLSPPLAATLELIVEKLPPLQIVSPVLEIVPAVNALRSVATHEPLDVVAEAHVPVSYTHLTLPTKRIV